MAATEGDQIIIICYYLRTRRHGGEINRTRKMRAKGWDDGKTVWTVATRMHACTARSRYYRLLLLHHRRALPTDNNIIIASMEQKKKKTAFVYDVRERRRRRCCCCLLNILNYHTSYAGFAVSPPRKRHTIIILILHYARSAKISCSPDDRVCVCVLVQIVVCR